MLNVNKRGLYKQQTRINAMVVPLLFTNPINLEFAQNFYEMRMPDLISNLTRVLAKARVLFPAMHPQNMFDRKRY